MCNSINPTWSKALPAPLAAGAIDVWRSNLDADFDASMLNHEERERATRFVFERDARRYSAARASLRRLLGAYLDEDPTALRFVSGQWGKPALADAKWPIAFNVSHSAGLALIAVGGVAEVGVDIEAVRPMDDRDAVAAQSFAPTERRQLSALSDDRREDAFFACWTRKEAVAKLWGEGISADLASIVVGIDPAVPSQVIATARRPGGIASDIALYSFKPHPDFWAALAAPAQERPRVRFLLQP